MYVLGCGNRPKPLVFLDLARSSCLRERNPCGVWMLAQEFMISASALLVVIELPVDMGDEVGSELITREREVCLVDHVRHPLSPLGAS